ncbi:MAG: hypothetical protein AB1725_11145 [Armatimonadota bacterium]
MMLATLRFLSPAVAAVWVVCCTTPLPVAIVVVILYYILRARK